MILIKLGNKNLKLNFDYFIKQCNLNETKALINIIIIVMIITLYLLNHYIIL